ncbi:hypothetical protein B0H13DRAFT_2039553 [Mycena leptocephala]|nr:hypothetical protein B0H13DRAFT_2039553 [Mycena leptocephala]
MSSFLLVSLEDCRQFVAQSPEFIRIFQASWLLHIHSFDLTSPTVSYIRFLLDLSWDYITTALSALHSIIGGGTEQQIVAGTITILALSLELYPASAPTVTSDLAAGCLRLIQRFGHSVAGDFTEEELAQFLWYGSPLPCGRWSRLLRCSPHSSPDHELLHELEEFVPPWHLFPGGLCPIDVYSVVKWLQALPDPPLKVIVRWQSFLSKSRDRCKFSGKDTDDDLERRWQKVSEPMVDFNKPTMLSEFKEEEVIRYVERIVEKKSWMDGGVEKSAARFKISTGKKVQIVESRTRDSTEGITATQGLPHLARPSEASEVRSSLEDTQEVLKSIVGLRAIFGDPSRWTKITP